MNENPHPSQLDDLPPMPQEKAVDNLCDEFERRIRAGEQLRIEDYLSRLPESARPFGFRQLLAVELELRRKAGQWLDAEDIRRRFPDYPTLVDVEIRRAEQEAVGALVAAESPSTGKSALAETSYERHGASRRLPAEPAASAVPLTETARQPALADGDPILERLGRYRIVRVLGEGGFGRVYLGEDTQLGRQVALKVPKKKFFESGNSVEVFLREASTAAKLKHAGLVTVHDVQQEDGRPYIVQEYIEGKNLHHWMRESGASHQQIVRLLIEIAEAVGFLHQQRLVHRDLKPGNILIDRQDHAHVTDFGLAIHESSQWAQAGEFAGTWQYMSPEQLRGETHLLNGRSDLWSLGVILYELLVGRRPFPATNPQELRDQVRTLEPRPPRQLAPDIHPELNRICLKCLQPQRADRYESAADLVDDLEHWLKAAKVVDGWLGQSASDAPADGMLLGHRWRSAPATHVVKADQPFAATRIVPKGLRSFDEHDADFFLELLPGARDRDGLPESIRFWKTRIEEPDPDKTFSVGLVYGPSGCGKSSLVKAGLLPRLASPVVSVYVEATADDTEVRLLKGLKKKLLPLWHLPDSDSLPAILQRLRQRGVGGGRKLLIVLDQFEQWLHAHGGEDGSQLVDALRHCDGGNVQCLALVRDDFWMPATRFMRAVEANLVEGHNSNPVDLFPIRHAEEVLTKFGRAFRTLPENFREPSPEQAEFIQQSVAGLAHEGKVICVRLSLFADMMKGKPWTPASLRQVGGTEGVGVTFLDEMFSSATAPPEHRLHQKAARAVLKALLPESGTDIKGNMRSYDELLVASGYSQRPREFAELMQILDRALRLITPTDPEGSRDDGPGLRVEDSLALDTRPSTLDRFYQLTHDYLVPSLREWLTRKQKETRRGRAELRLAERAALWNTKRENRHLPAAWEYANICLLTKSKNWTEPQKQMMRAATRHYGILGSCGLAVLLVAALTLQQFLNHQRRAAVRVQVDALQSTIGMGVPPVLRDLEELPARMVREELRTRFADPNDKRKLPLAYALANSEEVHETFLVDAVRDARAEECDNLVAALAKSTEPALHELKKAAETATMKQDWSLKTRLATIALHLGDPSIAANMLQAEPPAQEIDPQPDWQDTPLDPAWKPVPANATASIVVAHGMLADRFAFCQDMSWETFLAVIETLRPCGYRPTRVRPFTRDTQLLVAAVWTRDALRWYLDRDQTAEQLPSSDSPAVRDGMHPTDVSAYASSSGTLLYALLWSESGAEKEERRLMVGMTDDSFTQTSTTMSQAKFAAQLTLQVVAAADGTRRYTGIWSKQGPAVTPFLRFSGSELADPSAGDITLRDISLAPLGNLPNPLDSYRQQLTVLPARPPAEKTDATARLNRAMAHYFLGQPEQSLAELDGLVVQQPSERRVWQLRALSLAKLGKADEARQAYQEFEKACRPTDIKMGLDRYARILVSAWLGEIEEAKQQLDAMAAAAENDADVLYNAACTAAQMAGSLRQRDPVGAARLKVRSLELLRSAIAHGYRKVSHLQTDADLAPLHGERGFTAFVAELAPAGLYAGLRDTKGSVESRLLADLPVEQQLEQARQLAAGGFRPLTVTATAVVGNSQLYSAVIYHRAPFPKAKWYPIQRTMLIEHFPKWSGDIRKLADVVRGTEDAALRSGISLAVGSQVDASQETKDTWRPVLEQWYAGQPDSGTHSAAGWCLRNWGLPAAAIGPLEKSVDKADWRVTKLDLTMVRIPEGKLTISSSSSAAGSASPARRTVTIREFWLSDREVTRALFQQFMDDPDYKGDKPSDWTGVYATASPSDDHPVQQVSWYDALMFCNWLSWKEGLQPCYEKTGVKEKGRDNQGKEREYDVWRLVETARGYRLPMEREWEYACRAGTTTTFAFGEVQSLLDRYCVYGSDSAEKVGSKLCNAWGLFDMHGNVYEWCQDSESVSGGSRRVNRGGSWFNTAAHCRTAYRFRFQPDSRFNLLGIRVAQVQSR